nr:DNA repair protein recA homolog 1, chloroplastic [Ipomoea batatas]
MSLYFTGIELKTEHSLESWNGGVLVMIGVYYGNPEVTSGGIALKFFASVRLEIRPIGKIKSAKGDEEVGLRVRVRVQKSKQVLATHIPKHLLGLMELENDWQMKLSSSLLSVKGGERERKGVMEKKNGSERKGVIEMKNGGDGERDRREEICAVTRRKSESESAAEEEIWRRR